MICRLVLVLALLLVAGPAWAAPSIAATSTSSDNTADSDIVITLPSGIQAGDRLICVVADSDERGYDWSPAGFTELFDAVSSQAVQTLTAGHKVATGSEGATITITVDGSTDRTVHRCVRVTGAHATSAPEVGTTADGSSANPDPPTVTASWGAEDNLCLAFASNRTTAATFTAAPSGYTDLLQNDDTVEVLAFARKTCGSPENAGTFTMDQSDAWMAQTVVIRPAAVAAGTFRVFGGGFGAAGMIDN